MLGKKNKTHKVEIGKAKLSKNLNVTVNDLLARDDVNEVLRDIDTIKPEIDSLIAIWIDKDDKLHWEITDNTLTSQLIWALESVKHDMLNEDD